MTLRPSRRLLRSSHPVRLLQTIKHCHHFFSVPVEIPVWSARLLLARGARCVPAACDGLAADDGGQCSNPAPGRGRTGMWTK